MTSTKWRRASDSLIRSLRRSIRNQNQNDISRFCGFLLGTKRRGGTLYLVGAGRSFDVLRIFGARIMQEPISLPAQPLALAPKPHIGDDDSILICTGTGETASVISAVENWMRINENIGLITSFAAKKYNSSILKLITHPKTLLLLPGVTKRDIMRRRGDPHEIHPPLSAIFHRYTILIPSQTKFELSVLALLECVVTELYHSCRRKEDEAPMS